MWNDALKKIDPINTPKKAIDRWLGKSDTFSLISDGINLVYRFKKENENYYLRMTHSDLRPKKELLAAISYQRHLSNNDVPVCEVLISSNGLWAEEIIQDGEIFLAHVCKEVPGKPIDFDYKDHTLYENWGKCLAKL